MYNKHVTCELLYKPYKAKFSRFLGSINPFK